jgi:hypothetical protein
MNPINPMKTPITTKLMPLVLGLISLYSVTIPPAAHALNSLPSGRYTCWTFMTQASPYGVSVTPIAGAFGSFILDGNGKYTNRAFKTSGRYGYQGSTVTFSGGKFDGYSAEVKETEKGVSLKFKGESLGRTPAGRFKDQSCNHK